MSERLKIGLVGAGVFAGYHANKLAAHPRVEFTGVVDANDVRAAELAAKHGVKSLSLETLYEASDAVVIAAIASVHGDIALRALAAGCHCLIEKPIATTSDEAEAIVALASETGLTVQIGHQERMILRAIRLDQIDERPLKIEAVRNSPFSERGTDTSVTFDLMTHDIDLCTALMGGAADEVNGQSRCVKSEAADMAYVWLRYGQSIARLSASRVADESERWMKITYSTGEVLIDFNKKILSNTTEFALAENFADSDIAKDSLGAATDDFVCAILDGSPVLVSARDGAIAVRTAERIDKGT